MSDRKRMCLAALEADADGDRATEIHCLRTPMTAAFWPDMFGPVVLGDELSGGHREDWTAVVVDSTEQVVLYDGSTPVVDPVQQRTFRTADGLVVSFVSFRSVDDVLGPIPADRSREAQLCTRSKSVCRTAMPITWPATSPGA
ncbi:hypothetical protein [Kitasatospora cinereorecta]